MSQFHLVLSLSCLPLPLSLSLTPPPAFCLPLSVSHLFLKYWSNTETFRIWSLHKLWKKQSDKGHLCVTMGDCVCVHTYVCGSCLIHKSGGSSIASPECFYTHPRWAWYPPSLYCWPCWQISPSTPKSQGTPMLVTLPSTTHAQGLNSTSARYQPIRGHICPCPPQTWQWWEGGLHWLCEGSELPCSVHTRAHQHMLALFMGHTQTPQPARLDAETWAPGPSTGRRFSGDGYCRGERWLAR